MFHNSTERKRQFSTKLASNTQPSSSYSKANDMQPILCMSEFVYTLWCLCLCVFVLTNRYHNGLILNAPKEFCVFFLPPVTNYKLKSQFSSTILIPILGFFFLRKLSDRVYVYNIRTHFTNHSFVRGAACLIFLLLSLVSFHCFFLSTQFGFAGLNTEGNFPL